MLVMAFAAWGVYRLWDARLWPFSTGTSDKAFLGTTFGMSPQEVHRAVGKHGAQLLTYDEYKRSEPSPNIDTFGFIPVFSDDRRRDASLYMSSVEMFDSKVEAEFSFRDGRLASVGVHFDPIATSRSESVAATIGTKLRNDYQFAGHEESPSVPGAYTLHFTSPSVIPSLWVNLADREQPIIILTLVHSSAQMDRKHEVEKREHAAFGDKK